jgi:hypothetical protein
MLQKMSVFGFDIKAICETITDKPKIEQGQMNIIKSSGLKSPFSNDKFNASQITLEFNVKK